MQHKKDTFLIQNCLTIWIKKNSYWQTGLPAGDYCDVITGTRKGNSCSGNVITVDDNGRASIIIAANGEDAVLAAHVGPEVLYASCPYWVL